MLLEYRPEQAFRNDDHFLSVLYSRDAGYPALPLCAFLCSEPGEVKENSAIRAPSPAPPPPRSGHCPSIPVLGGVLVVLHQGDKNPTARVPGRNCVVATGLGQGAPPSGGVLQSSHHNGQQVCMYMQEQRYQHSLDSVGMYVSLNLFLMRYVHEDGYPHVALQFCAKESAVVCSS